MTRPHDGRGVVVAGGPQGVGLAAARRFVAEGAKVFVVGRIAEKLETALAVLGAAAAGSAGSGTPTRSPRSSRTSPARRPPT